MQMAAVVTDWPIRAFRQLVVKLERLFRGNYWPPVLMRRCVYSKRGCLILPVSLRRGQRRRSQDLELKGTANEDDDGHHGDNYRGHLPSLARAQVSPLHMPYLRHPQHKNIECSC